MGDLQKERLSIGKTSFNNTGVDWFGTYYVKRSKMTRTAKGVKNYYGALFTCLTTRAIHIEVAGDFYSDDFLLALRRFINRRETVKIIRSDDGTNFVGVNDEIKSLPEASYMCGKDIQWIFNPSASP